MSVKGRLGRVVPGPRRAVLEITTLMALAACGTSTTAATGPSHDAAVHAADARPSDAARPDVSVPRHDAAPVPSGPALPLPPVGHEGRWLTDGDGRVLLVHGVNMVEKDAPYYPSAAGFSDADAVWLSDNGFRVVRVGILATGLMPTPGVVDTSYIANVAATVKGLASHGIYSLIDFHQDGWGPLVGSDGFPAWMTLTGTAVNNLDAGFPLYYQDNPALQQAFQSFWDDATGPDGKGLQENYAAMFGAVAAAFADEPYILGYDLLNEPWPGTTWSACLNDSAGCPSLDTGELGPLYAKAVTAIRGAGDHHLIFGEPFVLFNFGVSTTSIPVPGDDSNAGMSFHVYPIAASESPGLIQNAVTWAESTHGALLNSEWGATEETSTLTTESLALDSALVPWIFWSFCCELVPSLDAAPGGTNLVASTAATLVQPYPLAVAGTPEKLTIDPATQTLSFTWSTVRPGGGTFAPGTVTTFEAPALTYPKGYSVTVTNGSVTSAPCATLLTVSANPGASSVTVDIKPGGTCG
jgi:endoglycosylceramidase